MLVVLTLWVWVLIGVDLGFIVLVWVLLFFLCLGVSYCLRIFGVYAVCFDYGYFSGF